MVLVTGATGYIGRRLVKKLVKDGYRVRAMVVPEDPLIKTLNGVDCEKVKGDITKEETLASCLKGVKTVFHLAAVLISDDPFLFHKINYEGTKNVVQEAINRSVEHFIYLSAAAAAYKIRTTYGESKLKAEGLMKKQNNTNFTIVRPTLVYGAGGSRELMIYLEALRTFPFVIPVAGFGRAKKRPVFIDDVVQGLTSLVDNPVSYGKIYNFSGGEEITMWKYTRLMCNTFKIRKPMVPVPIGLCYFIATILGLVTKHPPLRRDTILGVTMDANFSFEESEREIGYKPTSVRANFKEAFLRITK